MKFLAKSNKNILYAETVEEHTNKLIKLFEEFKSLYGSFFTERELELIKIACETHDLGKINYKFQKKIYKASNADFQNNDSIEKLYKSVNVDEIPHGILSCCFLDTEKLKEKYGKLDTQALTTSVYYHHNREGKDKNGDVLNFQNINPILEGDLKQNAKLFDTDIHCEYDGLDENRIEAGIVRVQDTYNFWLKFIVIKGMLNKIDYAASAYRPKVEEESVNAYEYVKKVFDNKNFKFNECQKFMKNNSDENIVVIASTGIGKTEASLLWANSSKTFYTLPLKVSINAIYERIIESNYYDKEKTTFLHSDTISYLIEHNNGEEFEDIDKRYKQTKALMYPLTVCTIDQLFYFVFKTLGTEIFPATLKYSKIIIDEIQSYTPEITAFILYGLKVITDLGGKFCIMTATLPPIIENIMEEKKIEYKKPDKVFFKTTKDGNVMARHFIEYNEADFDYEKIAEDSKSKKVLVICNTVKRSQDVYTRLKEITNASINLLHSRFILSDRRKKENTILDFAANDKTRRNNKTGIWVSTQIVEASLDIDFDVLYTDMATADSLLQRLGRCYRDREYKGSSANIFIYDSRVGVGYVYDEEIYNYSVEDIKKYNNALFTEEKKIEYINSVYCVERLKDSKYKKTIESKFDILTKLLPASIEKDIAEKQFRNIRNITVMPDKYYIQLQELFNSYNEAKESKNRESIIKLRDEILSYTTSVQFYFDKDKKPITANKDFNNIYTTDKKYSYELGLENKIDDEIDTSGQFI